MFYAGIDWADQKHDAVMLDETGRKLGAICVAHNPEGLAKLDEWLAQMLGQQSKDQMACRVETSHGLLIAFLLEHGWPVSPVNPRTVDRRRSASGAKTDTIDAYLLAKTGRADFADLHRLTPDSEKIAELKTLTRDQDSLIQMQTRLVNQLTACLKDYYPVALLLFSKLQQKSTLLFLQTYSTPEIAMGASVQQIAQTLKQAGHTRADITASTIFEILHQPHLSANEVTTRTKSRLMLALVAQLLPLIVQIAQDDKEIERLFLRPEDNTVFSSLPGAGKRLAPGLLAEIGDDPSRYESAESLQALGGTSPVLFQSGLYSKPHRRLGCIKPKLFALYSFARPRTQQEAWARAYDERKRAEGKSHSVTLRALSNIWVRIIFAMLRSHEPYMTATFEQAQQLHALKVA
jgi:transposase